MRRVSSAKGQLAATMVVVLGLGHASADTTWDGNGNSNNNGDWSVGANWDGDAVPTTSDRAILPSVSTGLRTVTQDTTAGTTANALRFEQSTATATNKLSLSGNLTFSKASREAGTPDSTTSALQASLTGGATHPNLALDLNGYALKFILSGGGATTGGNLSGTIAYNSAGSSIHSTVSGHTAFNVFGTLHVTADGRLGRDTGSVNATGNGAVTFMSGSLVNVSSGTFSAEMAGRRGQDRDFTLTNGGTVNIAAGATLAQVWTQGANSSNKANISLVNNNSVIQAGTVALRVHHDSASPTYPTMAVTDSGTWTVSGADAVIKRLTTTDNGAYIVVPTFTVGATSGTLRGSGAADALEFNEEVADGTRRMTITNNGLIAPGAGSQGTGTASVGTLTLKDINVAMGSTGKVYLDFGGSATGQYDQLRLETGATGPAGAGTLDLSAGGTLQLYTVNSFAPGDSFTVTLIAAGSVSGQFATVKLDGSTFVDNVLALPDGTRYALSYTADAVQLSYVGMSSGTLILLR